MKIAIIGAGAAGLASLKNSLAEGHKCTLFERNDWLGGTWKYVNETGLDKYGLPVHTSMYEHLRTNLPKELMQFEDFPYPDYDYSYLRHEEVLKYINNYAEKFKLLAHIRFATYVIEINPLPMERWSMKIKDLKTQIEEDLEFDAILICVGIYSAPFTPQVPNLDRFRGSVVHSHNYRRTNPYRNKRVLVVGGSFSGIDIAKALVPVAKQVMISHRGKMTVNIKLPSAITLKPEIKHLAESNVTFKDDTCCDVDSIIFCTGYSHSYPFLTPKCGITVKDNVISSLYKYIVNLEHPTMAFIGATKHVPIFPTVGLQVKFHLALMRGQIKVSKKDMLKDIQKYKLRCKELGTPPDQSLEKRLPEYLEDLANTAKVKRIPPVIAKMYEYVLHEKFQIFSLKYKIVNEDEFECCECSG